MYSILWNLIEYRSSRFFRLTLFLFVILGSVLFSVPRLEEGWFIYTLIIYPVAVATMLGLIKQVLKFLPRIASNSIELVETESDKEILDRWWKTLDPREHLLWCFAIGILLASLSLFFNANPSWSRYTDALGIFYIGFIAGEIVYLILLIPTGISQLRKYPLRLNPVFPANTVNLQILAESCLVLSLGIGIALFAINSFVATALYLFPHLIFGIIIISAISWMMIIGLSAYPHFILHQLTQQEKRKTLASLENKLVRHYQEIIDAENVTAASIDHVMNLHEQVNNSKTFPISNSAIGSLVFTLVLNLIPIFIGYFFN